MIGIGQDRLATGRLDRRDDFRFAGGDENRPDIRLHGATPDLHNHRQAMNVGEWLVRQPGRSQPGRDEDDR